MSELLEQAIVDAEALKEAALKNAEQAVIEKYSSEIKNAVETLLEQPMSQPEDMAAILGMGAAVEPAAGMGMMGGEEAGLMAAVPPAYGDGESLCPCPDEEEVLTIDLGAIAEALGDESENGAGPTVEDMTDREEFAEEVLSEGQEQEEINIDEASLVSMLEELTVDIRPSNRAPLGGNSALAEEYEEEVLALANDSEVAEEAKNYEELEENLNKTSGLNQQLQETVEKLNESNSSLQEENDKVKSVLMQMKDRLDEVNMSNAKLLYMNRVLGSNSLNERQKTKLVEALSKADSIEGARVIYETLQSAVGEVTKSKPKSLSEAVSHRISSKTLPSRVDVKPVDPVTDRWKKLAGITNKN